MDYKKLETELLDLLWSHPESPYKLYGESLEILKRSSPYYMPSINGRTQFHKELLEECGGNNSVYRKRQYPHARYVEHLKFNAQTEDWPRFVGKDFRERVVSVLESYPELALFTWNSANGFVSKEPFNDWVVRKLVTGDHAIHPQSKVIEVVSKIKPWLENERVQVRYGYFCLGLYLTKEITLGKNIVLKPLSYLQGRKDIFDRIKVELPFDKWLQEPRIDIAVVESTYERSATDVFSIGLDEKNEMEERLEARLRGLSLITALSIKNSHFFQPMFSIEYPEFEMPTVIHKGLDSFAHDLTVDLSPKMKDHRSELVTEGVLDLLSCYNSLSQVKQNRISLGLAKVQSASTRTSFVNRAIELRTALEVLLGVQGSSKGKKISERGSEILHNGSARAELKALYGVCSTASHECQISEKDVSLVDKGIQYAWQIVENQIMHGIFPSDGNEQGERNSK